MSINVQKVTKLYGKQKALDAVSFQVNTGEVLGFIGPNGAGKSTMMKIITCFLPPTDGKVEVNGIDVMENPLEAKKLIGYLPENNPLYLNMYIKEYLEFAAGIYNPEKNSKKRIDEVISLTGITPEKHKKIGALSKGFRQRVGIAQALLHNPAVLILDEPTTGLDPNQILEIRNLISEIGKEKTVILSTHIMQEVDAICNRIVIINKGKIVANDRKENICSHVNTKKETIVVEFNTAVKESDLKTINGVENAVHISDVQWLIETASGIDIREKVFEFAVAKKIAVLSMLKKEERLEDVFRQLTKK